MSIRTILIGSLAIVLGLAAAVGIFTLLTTHVNPTEGVDVVMASKEIPRFSTITPDQLKVEKVPKHLVPPQAVKSVEEALDRSSATFIGAGEIILETHLGPRGVRGMATVIPPGMRAVTIRTPDVSTGVAGFALPGSKVDVLLTVRGSGYGDVTGGGSTVTLLEKVEVLAVDQRVESPPEQKVDVERLRSVTLLVTPEQATKLDLGQTLGTLHLSLRNPLDQSVAIRPGVSLRELRLPGSRPPDVPPARQAGPPVAPTKVVPPPPAIRVLRGAHSSYAEVR